MPGFLEALQGFFPVTCAVSLKEKNSSIVEIGWIAIFVGLKIPFQSYPPVFLDTYTILVGFSKVVGRVQVAVFG